MTSPLAHLAELARKATAGPWRVQSNGTIQHHVIGDRWGTVAFATLRFDDQDCPIIDIDPNDAAYIAAASPSTVLALVEENAALRKALLESPAMAEMMRELPGALRLRTQETADLKARIRELEAGLTEACDVAEGLRETPSVSWAALRKLAGP